MKNKYYQFVKEGNIANLKIYGDIVDDVWCEGEVSALSFIQELEAIGDVDEINVHINSYGGSVSQGLTIYNQLKNHKAKVTTICDGFACSIASVIFMAGDERIMNQSSILMIHNPWTNMAGNAEELRKQADSLDKMADLSIDIYMKSTDMPYDIIKRMLDDETWISPSEALEMGFATKVNQDKEVSLITQSVKENLMKMIFENKITKEESMDQDNKQVDETTEIVEKVETLEPTVEILEEGNKEETPEMKLNENKNNKEMEMEFDMLNKDNEVMKNRGQRQLTSAEEKFYNRFMEACKSRHPQQAFIELEGNEETAMPETIIEDVFKDMVENHPLLAKINAVYAGFSTKWILNAKEKQSAVWGEIDGEITKEITGAFKTVDIRQHKLSAFAQIPLGILDLGRTFLDAYIRKVLADSIACALEAAIVNGDGKDCPVGLMKNLTGALDGVHQDKEVIKITELSPKQVNGVIAKIAVTETGHQRNIDKVQMIVNNVDYLTKVLPAIQTLNMNGQYVSELPFPTEIIVCNEVPTGKAIMCKLDEYFLGIAGGKEGQIEFSDDYKFLEDKRTFKVKIYATGMPKDNNMAQVLDISELNEKVVKTKQA